MTGGIVLRGVTWYSLETMGQFDCPVDANLRGCPEVTRTIYLANPYGFSAQQRMMLLPPIVAALEELGLEVWEPFARNNQADFLKTGWAYRIGQRDFEDVAAADAIFAVVNGVPPDEGVMVELGMAIALESGRAHVLAPRRFPSRCRQ